MTGREVEDRASSFSVHPPLIEFSQGGRLRPAILIPAFLALAGCDLLGPDAPTLEGEVAVALDPIGRTPLAGIVTFRTSRPSTASLRLLGADDGGFETSEPRREHEIPVLGLFPGQDNAVELEISTSEGVFHVDTLVMTTQALRADLPEIEVTIAAEESMEPGWTLSALAMRDQDTWAQVPIMFDAQGRIRWYADLSEDGELVFPLEPLGNGNLIGAAGDRVFEYDWLGRHERVIRLAGYSFHHDVIEKPDGNLLVAVDRTGLATVEDFIIELDRTSGAIVREIDLRTLLDVDRRATGGDDEDWLHVNSLWYDTSDGGIIFSGLYQGVAKVSLDDELQWILAPHRGWGPAGVNGDGAETSDLLLTAVDDNGTPYGPDVQDGAVRGVGFDWPWYQHGAMLLPTGTLFMFDNGVNRNFESPGEAFSRGVEYAIDPDAMTVRQLWTFGEARGAEYQSRFISDVDHLPMTGNRLIMPGRTSRSTAWVTEVTEGGEVVFDAQIRFKDTTGPHIVYRSERVLPRR